MHAEVKRVKSCLLKLLNKVSSFKQQKGPSMWSIVKQNSTRTNEMNMTELVIVYPQSQLVASPELSTQCNAGVKIDLQFFQKRFCFPHTLGSHQ